MVSVTKCGFRLNRLVERASEVAAKGSGRGSEHDPPTDRDEVLLICVNYLKPAETQRLVSSAVDQILSSPLRVIVVENSPSPDSQGVPESLKGNPRVRAFATGKNLGYFGGAAAALKEHLETHPRPEWVIVSNPDVYFPDRDVLQRLCDAEKGHEPAVIAPSIRTVGSSVEQNPYMRVRPSRVRMRIYSWIFSFYPTDIAYQGLSWIKHRVLERMSRESPTETAQTASAERIYAPHGSFIALHRSYFEHGGTLDHGTFLFGEEIFVAETARRLGLTVLYEPSLVIEHTERSTGIGLFRRDTALLRKQASQYLAKTFFNE